MGVAFILFSLDSLVFSLLFVLFRFNCESFFEQKQLFQIKVLNNSYCIPFSVRSAFFVNEYCVWFSIAFLFLLNIIWIRDCFFDKTKFLIMIEFFSRLSFLILLFSSTFVEKKKYLVSHYFNNIMIQFK